MNHAGSTQDRVGKFVQSHQLQTSVQMRLLDLTSEVGELAKEALKATEYGQTEFQPTPGWREEIGDVYFSLLCLADQTGIALDEALDEVLDKYAQRLAARRDAGSGR